MTVSKYEIDMLDVEDADAFLIHFLDEKNQEYVVLVDAGRYSDGKMVSDFIKKTYETYDVDFNKSALKFYSTKHKFTPTCFNTCVDWTLNVSFLQDKMNYSHVSIIIYNF